MSDPNDTPSTEELANELAATEGTDSPETAPDPAPVEPEAPAAQADPPAPDPEPDPAPAKTIAPPLNTAQADKKAADTTRRKKVIADTETPELPLDEAEEKRKAGIRAAIEEVQEALTEALALAETCRADLRELMADLYPHMVDSDKLVDSVRGHIAAQKKIRANRASNPARIAEILKAAGRSPIDQAFHVQRARGMGRPTRSQAKPAADNSGGGSDANAGSE
jgi:hypothetical protein